MATTGRKVQQLPCAERVLTVEFPLSEVSVGRTTKSHIQRLVVTLDHFPERIFPPTLKPWLK